MRREQRTRRRHSATPHQPSPRSAHRRRPSARPQTLPRRPPRLAHRRSLPQRSAHQPLRSRRSARRPRLALRSRRLPSAHQRSLPLRSARPPSPSRSRRVRTPRLPRTPGGRTLRARRRYTSPGWTRTTRCSRRTTSRSCRRASGRRLRARGSSGGRFRSGCRRGSCGSFGLCGWTFVICFVSLGFIVYSMVVFYSDSTPRYSFGTSEGKVVQTGVMWQSEGCVLLFLSLWILVHLCSRHVSLTLRRSWVCWSSIGGVIYSPSSTYLMSHAAMRRVATHDGLAIGHHNKATSCSRTRVNGSFLSSSGSTRSVQVC